ncbi:lysostaphin resistance A-like protein, partial [Blautia sp. HCP3S3_D9]
MAVFARTAANSAETYYNYTIFLTGLTGILAMIPALYFYRRDKVRRIAGGLIPAQKKVPLSLLEIILLLLAGAGLAQYGNFLMAILQSFINSSAYQESMTRITEGKSLLMMIFWMGIIAPAAEEMIFRWLIYLRLRDWLKMPVAAVISGLIFGIYHGNIVQGIYA